MLFEVLPGQGPEPCCPRILASVIRQKKTGKEFGTGTPCLGLTSTAMAAGFLVDECKGLFDFVHLLSGDMARKAERADEYIIDGLDPICRTKSRPCGTGLAAGNCQLGFSIPAAWCFVGPQLFPIPQILVVRFPQDRQGSQGDFKITMLRTCSGDGGMSGAWRGTGHSHLRSPRQIPIWLNRKGRPDSAIRGFSKSALNLQAAAVG